MSYDDEARYKAFRRREGEIIQAWEEARVPFLRMAVTVYGVRLPTWLLAKDGTLTMKDDGLTPENREQIDAIRKTLEGINESMARDLAESRRIYGVPA